MSNTIFRLSMLKDVYGYEGQIGAVKKLLMKPIEDIWVLTSDMDDHAMIKRYEDMMEDTEPVAHVSKMYHLYESENEKFVFFYADGGLSVWFIPHTTIS